MLLIVARRDGYMASSFPLLDVMRLWMDCVSSVSVNRVSNGRSYYD